VGEHTPCRARDSGREEWHAILASAYREVKKGGATMNAYVDRSHRLVQNLDLVLVVGGMVFLALFMLRALVFLGMIIWGLIQAAL
jgi:hypothetical protein